MTDVEKEEPTLEQIRAEARVQLADGRVAVARWYPSMGGYVSRCWVVFFPGAKDTCFDVFVWHDGEFAFGGAPPVRLHHCSPEDFASFARDVLAYMGKG